MAINASGIVAGFAHKYDGAGSDFGSRAVYWGTDGIAVDINTLIAPASGWTLTEADAISDGGWISGLGTFDPDGPGGQVGYTRAFLVQIPEPGALGMFGGAALMLVRRCRRRV